MSSASAVVASGLCGRRWAPMLRLSRRAVRYLGSEKATIALCCKSKTTTASSTTSSSSSPSAFPSSCPLTQLIRTRNSHPSVNHPHIFTLECPSSSKAANEMNRLFQQGLIAGVTAVVRPDLPVVNDFGDMFSRTSKRPDYDVAFARAPQLQRVRTIGCHLRTPSELRQLLLQTNTPAVMFVSGGGLFQKLVPKSLLPLNSVRALTIASGMRARGDIDPHLMLWATANPLKAAGTGRANIAKNVDWLRRKVDAGAEAILTQPPLLWDEFERWWEAVTHAGLHRHTSIVAGLPILTTSRSVKFWLQLCGVNDKHQSAEQLVKLFLAAEARDSQEAGQQPTALVELRQQWAQQALRRLLDQHVGLAGIHFMPLQAWRDLQPLLSVYRRPE
eukprot:jgi/Chlat1/2280/Chrsp17S02581